MSFSFFSSAIYLIFFNDTATTEIYTYGHTLSLHDALPILEDRTSIPCRLIMSRILKSGSPILMWRALASSLRAMAQPSRSEEHTSELQSLMRISYAVFCLKKKTEIHTQNKTTDYDEQHRQPRLHNHRSTVNRPSLQR